MSNQRLEVLTTVHNFDIRGLGGKTPAERLFQKPFDLHIPDLFDFALQSVTLFPEPRYHKTPINVDCPSLETCLY